MSEQCSQCKICRMPTNDAVVCDQCQTRRDMAEAVFEELTRTRNSWACMQWLMLGMEWISDSEVVGVTAKREDKP